MLGEILLISQTYYTGFGCFLDMPIADYYELMPGAISSAEYIRKKLKRARY